MLNAECLKKSLVVFQTMFKLSSAHRVEEKKGISHAKCGMLKKIVCCISNDVQIIFSTPS